MKLSRSARRRGLVVLAVTTVAATAVAMVIAPSAQAVQQPGGGMSKADRALLAQAVVNGDATVTLLVAAKAGAAAQVASGISSLGGSVGYREDEVGYLRAVVPTGKAGQVGSISGVDAVDVDEIIPLDDPRPDGQVVPTPQTAPGPATPNNNPYMPIGDTGASQFMAAHPTWDGRGVKVGIIDSGVDLENPALQTTSTGARKIVDWVTATHPVTDNDPTWISMATTVTGPTFTFGGATYTAPTSGNFRFGTINERQTRLGGEIGSDLNRDGNPAGSSGVFGVLWDGDAKVWVDTDQDFSFADQAAMRDYKRNFDQGRFGVDNPATPVVEQLPFVVQVRKDINFVNIGIVSAQHGSHVAGIVAANKMFGGAMSGAAPGAELVSVRVCLFNPAGCTAHALIEGMIYAAKDANVDVINMSIGGLPSLNDGNNARALLYDRLIDRWNVQMFISAGNSGAGMNTVGDPSVANKVVSVGTYISNATWASNYGSSSPLTDNQHGFSSRGPREDGGFKPSVIAPGAAISTTPLWQPGGPVPGTYVLPPGFSMLNGTSMASPQAAGATALLVSAAKQANVAHRPEQIRQALHSSARYITNYQAYEQGNGLINVGAAYDLLKQNINTVEITSRVPVNTTLSGFLATPGIGVGIHDREGVSAGVAYSRTYTFTRTSGVHTPVTYNLTWVGNDGTFSSPSTLTIPRGNPASLTVGINPAQGEHSAILNLDDPSTVGIDYQTLNVVVAPFVFTAANSFTVVNSGTIGRNQVKHYFFRVPAGTPAFKVDFAGPDGTGGTGQARFVRFHPFGVNIDDNSSLNCYSPPPPGGGCGGGTPNSRTQSNPQAGVWEVVVEARRTSDVAFTPFTLTASILGASVAPNPDQIASAKIGSPVARSYTLTNLFGPFTGRAVGTTLGSARLAKPTIADLGQQQFPVNVTQGSTSLRATIGGPSDPGADLDLFVFNCTTGSCVQAGVSADGDSEESVTIANPAAGLWIVLVDGFAVPAGATTYNYVDVFANGAFGSVSITDANALRPAGASWTVPGSVTANAAPALGRVLLGNVQVRTDTNVLIGSGDVIVQSVTP